MLGGLVQDAQVLLGPRCSQVVCQHWIVERLGGRMMALIVLIWLFLIDNEMGIMMKLWLWWNEDYNKSDEDDDNDGDNDDYAYD